MWPTIQELVTNQTRTFILGLNEAAQRRGRLFKNYSQIKHKPLSWDLVRLHRHVADYSRVRYISNTNLDNYKKRI